MTIPDSIIDLDPYKIAIYIYIRRKCGSKQMCSITMSEIANRYGLKRPTVHKYLQQLIIIGVLHTKCQACDGVVTGACQKRDKKHTLISLKPITLDCGKNSECDGVVTGACQKRDKVVTIEDRKKRFAESLRMYLKEYGRDTLNAFYSYWTEINENGKKMRFEKEDTFEIAKRLRTWKKNETSFNKGDSEAMIYHKTDNMNYENGF